MGRKVRPHIVMNDKYLRMNELFQFLMELDTLKSIYRDASIADLSRKENSAEHSWHLAMAILTFKEEFDIEIDTLKTIKMALIHDVCEIGAGDSSIYSPDREKVEVEERKYIQALADIPVKFASKIKLLWEEYESQLTTESRWVKVFDRLIPFMLHIETDGKYWKENKVKKRQVIEISEIIKTEAPDVFDWLLANIDKAVERGWLKEA